MDKRGGGRERERDRDRKQPNREKWKENNSETETRRSGASKCLTAGRVMQVNVRDTAGSGAKKIKR